MFDVMLISHGPLSKAMLESAEMICGKQDGVLTLGFYEGDSIEEFRSQVYSCISEHCQTKDVLVITDIMCGSPFNVTASAMRDLSFHHITGMNLPMVVQVLLDRQDTSIEDVCFSTTHIAESYVRYVNDLLVEDEYVDELELADEELTTERELIAST